MRLGAITATRTLVLQDGGLRPAFRRPEVGNLLYINPEECVDCGACKLICRVGAIYYETDLPEDEQQHLADNAAFFSITLPGREDPLGCPAGAAELGRIGVDTPVVAALPRSHKEHRNG